VSRTSKMSLWRGLTSIVSRGAMLSNAKNVSEEPPLDLGDQPKDKKGSWSCSLPLDTKK
jgi:hypothetical protein